MNLQDLKSIYTNLNLGQLPQVMDELDFPFIEKHLKSLKTNEQKVIYLANLAGVPTYDVEAILSNFTKMKKLREELFTEWLEKGRPDTHIMR